jgi:hypothetical protein
MDKLEDRDLREHKDVLDFRDLKVDMETRVRRGTRVIRETRDDRVIRELLEIKEIREIRETKDQLDLKGQQVHLVPFRDPLDRRVLQAGLVRLDRQVHLLARKEHKAGLVLRDLLDHLEPLGHSRVETS